MDSARAQRRLNDRTVLSGDAGLIHKQFNFVDRLLFQTALTLVAQGVVVAPDDLLTGGLTDDVVIGDAVSHHVYPHIGGGFIGTLSHNLFEDGVEDRENFHIPVIVDGLSAVGVQIEGVNHVDVIEVGACTDCP